MDSVRNRPLTQEMDSLQSSGIQASREIAAYIGSEETAQDKLKKIEDELQALSQLKARADLQVDLEHPAQRKEISALAGERFRNIEMLMSSFHARIEMETRTISWFRRLVLVIASLFSKRHEQTERFYAQNRANKKELLQVEVRITQIVRDYVDWLERLLAQEFVQRQQEILSGVAEYKDAVQVLLLAEVDLEWIESIPDDDASARLLAGALSKAHSQWGCGVSHETAYGKLYCVKMSLRQKVASLRAEKAIAEKKALRQAQQSSNE